MKVGDTNYILDTNWAFIYRQDGVALRLSKKNSSFHSEQPVNIYQPNVEDIYNENVYSIIKNKLEEFNIFIDSYEYNTTMDGVLIVYGQGVNMNGNPREFKKRERRRIHNGF